MLKTKQIDKFDDLIDVRDIIARVEELEEAVPQEDIDNLVESDDATELVGWRELLSDLVGTGGDEKWRGDWYPVTMIRDSYFRDYAQELAEDCGMLNDSDRWPYTCIDWDRAARDLKMDYTGIDFDGVTYWVR